MAAHSTLVGGSIAARRLNCPASFAESLKQPQGARVSSVYADRGSALHEIMTDIAKTAKMTRGRLFRTITVKPGNYGGYDLTQEEIDTAIVPAQDAVDALMQEHGGDFKIEAIEGRVRFSGLPAAFGTVDLILCSKTHIIIVDYKFGLGVPVAALYPDPELGDVVNEQLMYYATAARHTYPKLFGRRAVILAIVQPAFEPAVTQTTTDAWEMEQFTQALHKAIDNALSDDPVRKRGEWCRFAECKATCSLWTGPLLDLSAIDPTKAALTQSTAPSDWGAYLARAKHLVDSAVQFKKTIDEMLMQHLRDGGRVPGFALKPRAMDRKWLDDAGHVADQLEALGLSGGEIWQMKLQTFKVVDAAAKRLGVVIPEELRPKPPSTEMTLTAEGDPEAIDLPAQAHKFRAALAALKR